MMKHFKIGNNKGVILIEAILALTVIVVILTALVTALVSAVSSSNFSKDQSLAGGYAQEGLEIARNDKDISFGELKNMTIGTYCLSGTELTLIGKFAENESDCSENIDEKFSRSVYVNGQGRDDRVSPGQLKCRTNRTDQESIFVASKVTWTDSRCSSGSQCHEVELNSCFINLNRIDAP